MIESIAAESNCGDGECYNMTEGDMLRYVGIFLSAAEVHINGNSDPADYSLPRIQALLRDFILRFRSPSTHRPLHHVVAALRAAGVPGADGLRDFAASAFAPPPAAREPLLAALSDMRTGVGCGHIMFMNMVTIMFMPHPRPGPPPLHPSTLRPSPQ
jgi:hypothetical protein